MGSLERLRILAAEDELLVAMQLEDILRTLGCAVVGPVASLADALEAARGERLDGAVIDVNLRGELIFPAAEILVDRGVPILFCSGYIDASLFPEAFRDHPRITKPYHDEMLQQALVRMFAAAA